MCENLKALGIEVTLLEKLPQVTPGLDAGHGGACGETH
jgi:pyruvate/2-oxoglutarate dehydrogenase complex dihydrolipoamide dehydrogenase (E3) component